MASFTMILSVYRGDPHSPPYGEYDVQRNKRRKSKGGTGVGVVIVPKKLGNASRGKDDA